MDTLTFFIVGAAVQAVVLLLAYWTPRLVEFVVEDAEKEFVA